MIKIINTLLALFIWLCTYSQSNTGINDTLIPVHDPAIIAQDGSYYLFGTGRGIAVYISTDRKHWKKQNPVFNKAPLWAVNAVAGFNGHIWAPDISYRNGLYYLFYSVSMFGKNTSCIGLATNKTLDTASADFKWHDHGKVIQSIPGRDMWNAIDPNLINDENNIPWLAFGSFWGGLKLLKLDSSLQHPAQPETWYTIAARKREVNTPDTNAGDAAIEAPFIYMHNGYYYLFVSVDYCCRGEKSNYKMLVGRSSKVYGPYLDKDAMQLNKGGGTLLLQGNSRWHGVGHNAVINFDGVDYLFFHAYDGGDKGKSKLRSMQINWVDDWPVVVAEN